MEKQMKFSLKFIFYTYTTKLYIYKIESILLDTKGTP